MPGSDPQIGDVYYYPYVWKRQFAGAEAEKDRPCCVAIRLQKGSFDGINVFMLAISKSGTPEGGDGIKIPTEELQRIKGLDYSSDHWLTTSEDNRTVHDSPVFDEFEYRGTFSADFMKTTVRPRIKELIMNSATQTGT